MCNPIAIGAGVGAGASFLGASNAARAENKARRQEYEAALQKREIDWMNELVIAGAERVQYEQGIDESALALGEGYENLEAERNALIAQALQTDETSFKKFLQTDESADLEASGRTGRSIDRVVSLSLGDYLKEGSRNAYALTQNEFAFKESVESLRNQAKADRSQLFANVMWQKVPGFTPPKPVKRNVLVAGLTAGVQGAVSGATAGKIYKGM